MARPVQLSMAVDTAGPFRCRANLGHVVGGNRGRHRASGWGGDAGSVDVDQPDPGLCDRHRIIWIFFRRWFRDALVCRRRSKDDSRSPSWTSGRLGSSWSRDGPAPVRPHGDVRRGDHGRRYSRGRPVDRSSRWDVRPGIRGYRQESRVEGGRRAAATDLGGRIRPDVTWVRPPKEWFANDSDAS